MNDNGDAWAADAARPCKAPDAGQPNRRARAVGVTVLTRTEEGMQVEHCPAGGVGFEDAVQEVWLDPGDTVVIYHGPPSASRV